MIAVADLQEGDPAVVLSRNRATRVRVGRLTKTQIVLADGDRFRRTNGDRVGERDPWDWVRLVPVDDPGAVRQLAEQEVSVLRDRLIVKIKSMSADQLHRVADWCNWCMP